MDQKQFDALLSDAETRLRRLKVLYDQWFVGIERVEPSQAHKEFEDLLGRLRKEPPNNTAQRFRLQQLVQRHVTLTAHWRRIGRQIEEGTYQRDLQRARRRKQRDEEQPDPNAPELDLSYDVALDAELADALAEAERLAGGSPPAAARAKTSGAAGSVQKLPLGAAGPSPRPAPGDASAPSHSLTPFAVPDADTKRLRPPLPPKVPPPPPPPLLKPQPAAAGPAAPARPGLVPGRPAPPAPPPGARPPAAAAVPARPGAAAAPPPAVSKPAAGGAFSDQDIERVFTQYVAARGRNAERTDNVKRETIEKTIRGMLPQLQQKHAGKQIDFEVIVKDGRVALKPVAK
jgi:hypothetical protein